MMLHSLLWFCLCGKRAYISTVSFEELESSFYDLSQIADFCLARRYHLLLVHLLIFLLSLHSAIGDVSFLFFCICAYSILSFLFSLISCCISTPKQAVIPPRHKTSLSTALSTLRFTLVPHIIYQEHVLSDLIPFRIGVWLNSSAFY